MKNHRGRGAENFCGETLSAMSRSCLAFFRLRCRIRSGCWRTRLVCPRLCDLHSPGTRPHSKQCGRGSLTVLACFFRAALSSQFPFFFSVSGRCSGRREVAGGFLATGSRGCLTGNCRAQRSKTKTRRGRHVARFQDGTIGFHRVPEWSLEEIS